MSRERNGRIVLASGAGLAQRIAQLLSALITIPLVLHVLGVAEFGIWGAATSLAWLAGMLDFGLGAALITLVAAAVAAGDAPRARAHVTAALLGGVALAAGLLALGGVCFALRPPSAPFLVAGIGLAVNIPLGMASNLWFGLQKGHFAGVWEFGQTLLTLLLLIAAALAGGGVIMMVGAVYAGLLLGNAGSLAHLLLSQPAIRPRHWRVSQAALRAVARPGLVLFAITLAGASAYAFDNLLALDWLGPPAAARMTVALRVCTTATGLLAAFIQPLWPAFSEAAAADDRVWEARTLRLGTTMVALLAIAGSALIIAFGQPVLTFWLRRNLGLPPALLWAMAGWIVAHNIPRVAAMLLNAVAVLRLQAAATVLAAGLAFALKFPAAAHFGAAGLLSATSLAWLLVIWPALFIGARLWTRRALPITHVAPPES